MSGSPQVLRGLTSADKDKADWKKHDLVIKGVHIYTVPLYHDEKNGTERGKNAAFVFEPERGKDSHFARIVHLGDLGHTLTDAQIQAIGVVDLVLVPVGGHFTIDAAGARTVSDQIARNDAYIVPMHYKTPALKPELPLATADAFLALFKGHVRKIDGNAWDAPGHVFRRIAGPTEVIDLGYEPKAGGVAKVEEGKPVGKAAGTVKITESRAWINHQGPGPGSILYSLTVDAQAGADGGTLAVWGQVSLPVSDAKMVKLAGADFEDDAGKAQPDGGWPLKPGEKKTVKLVAREGGTPVLGKGVMVSFVTDLTPASGGKPVQDTASPAIQDVR